jgi:excisionase family DNA binding protein
MADLESDAMIEKHYSPREVCKLLSISRSNLQCRIKSGELEAIAWGKRWLIPESAIQRILDAGRINPVKPTPRRFGVFSYS